MGIRCGSNKEKKSEPVVSDRLFESIFEFKIQAKELNKQSIKSNKEKEILFERVRQAILDNKPDLAKVYAEDAIRKRNESIKYQTLSFKLEAVHSKLKAAYQTSKLNENIGKMVNKMSTAVNAMDVVKISETITQFETIFDDLSANSDLMHNALDKVEAGTYQEKDVSNLIMQVAKRNNMELQKDFDDIQRNSDPKIVEKWLEKDKPIMN